MKEEEEPIDVMQSVRTDSGRQLSEDYMHI